MAGFSKNRLFSRIIGQFNNDLTIKTTSLETEARVTATTLTKTFTENEEYAVTLAGSISISPIVSGTKEVAPSDVNTKSQWDVNSTGSNYDLHDTAYDTTLSVNDTLDRKSVV